MGFLKSTLFNSVLMSVYYKHAHLPVNPPLKKGSILQTFDLTQDKCGDVCNTTIGPEGTGKYDDVVKNMMLKPSTVGPHLTLSGLNCSLESGVMGVKTTAIWDSKVVKVMKQ